MLVTNDEVKTFIGLDLLDTEYDVEITAVKTDAETLLYSILKVNTLETNEVTEWAYYDNDSDKMSVSNFPVTDILQIWGVDYAGVENVDYILSWTTIEFINVPSADIINWKVLVKYNAWYITAEIWYNVPNNVKLAVKYLASWLWNTKKEVGVTAVKIWQESYSFTSITDWQDFLKILSQLRGKWRVFIL